MRQLAKSFALFILALDGAFAAEWTPPAGELDPPGSVEATRGCQLVRDKQADEAVALLRPLVASSSMDLAARACYATALSLTGSYEEARQQISIVLSWKSAWPDGYVVRAVSAAEMGAVRRARQDLELAHRLDPQDRSRAIGPASERIEKALATVPGEPATTLHAELLGAARSGAALDHLAERAVRLLKASNVERRLGDEMYSDRRRRLAWAVLADPKDPDRLASLARFLLDEVDVPGEAVEQAGYTVSYRFQDKALKQAELKEARRLFNEALTLQPNHVPSLVGLARMDIRDHLWSNAERYLRRAIAIGPAHRDVLGLLRDVLRGAAAQRAMTTGNLRMTYRWEDALGNTVYEYAETPSAARLATANDYDAQAARLIGASRDSIRRALITLAGDPASHDFVGAMALAARDWQVAARAWERAVSLDPEVRAYRHSLAQAYAELGQLDASMEQAALGRNLDHTTAATQLEASWDLIAAGSLTAAADLLDKTVTADPAEVRTVAFMAVIAEAQGDPDRTLALYRAAFALEEAHARQRGSSWIRGEGSWDIRDTGRAIALRSRIADLLSTRDPEQAAGLYLKIAAIESSFGATALKEPLDTAMLPLPNLPPDRRQVAPAFGELLRTNRAWAAVELAQLGRCEQAALHFRSLPAYDERIRAGGTIIARRLRDEVWKTRRVVAAAVECFERLRDEPHLNFWRNLPTGAPETEWRRFVPTEPGIRRRAGWLRN